MTAQEKLIEYASKHNKGTFYTLTDEEFVGKMATEGCVINRTSASKTSARARREGKTIIVTETTITDTHEVVGGKMVFCKSETTSEVLRIEL